LHRIVNQHAGKKILFIPVARLKSYIFKTCKARRIMMRIKRIKLVALSMVTAMAFAGTVLAGAETVNLFVDSAPNFYGSPDWAPWWSNTKQDVVNGSFTNMRNGTYTGTNFVSPLDIIAYSDGDFGKRVSWIYWLPGETTAGLQDRFQVKYSLDWKGSDMTEDWAANRWIEDAPENGWIQPTSWEDYNDGTNQGVIGSLSFDLWAKPGEAEKYALAAKVFQNQSYLKGLVRYRDDADSVWNTNDLNLNLTGVPLPASALMGLAGLAVVGFIGWRRKIIA